MTSKAQINVGRLPLLCLVLTFSFADSCFADDATDDQVAPQWYSLHIQGTSTTQNHPAFPSAIPDGPLSMKAHAQTATTNDVTLFAGLKLGILELYANPEMDQGFGLSNTVGAAGYTVARLIKSAC